MLAVFHIVLFINGELTEHIHSVMANSLFQAESRRIKVR